MEQLPIRDLQEHQIHVRVDGEIRPSGSTSASFCTLAKLSVVVLHCNHRKELADAAVGLWPLAGVLYQTGPFPRPPCFLTLSDWFSASLRFSSHLLVAFLADEHSPRGALLISKKSHWRPYHSTTLAKPVPRSRSPEWQRLSAIIIYVASRRREKKGRRGETTFISFCPALRNDLLMPWWFTTGRWTAAGHSPWLMASAGPVSCTGRCQFAFFY